MKEDLHNQRHIILSVLKQYGHVFSNLEFVVLTATSSFVYMLVYIYLSEIPFLLAKLDYSTKDFSLFPIPISIALL
ncbi:multidrug effflux MFS transporter [Francisella sp. LA112445]|uniref:multidrug effflux MFS transporter n=1 Tax=Francisella sp. LA112445 TaxID=1395624 RepID=UPI001788B52D|nr:multidrug effflux MFS transporter [Francisella sp. LA112445]QIW10960.1 multidrug effflux MFS transporter [Francisella sp. LA112445]